MPVTARAKGTGVASAENLPGVRLVRAFNTMGSGVLRSEAGRSGDKVAVPLAADEAALKIAIQLVRDAGFEPVVVGPLDRAKEFDTGTAVFGKALTAAELRRTSGSAPDWVGASRLWTTRLAWSKVNGSLRTAIRLTSPHCPHIVPPAGRGGSDSRRRISAWTREWSIPAQEPSGPLGSVEPQGAVLFGGNSFPRR